jgi:AcrR family transcriptional regulator
MPLPARSSARRRERQKTETRQRILDAARELFVRDGIEATTMRAIAARIEYTPTAIYHHFRDKESLIAELCLVDFASLGSALYRIGRIEDPVERLKRMGLAYIDFALENKSQYRFMFMTQREHPRDENGMPVRHPEEDAYAFLHQTVSEGIIAGRFRPELNDPDELAQLVWGGIHGVVSLWMTHGTDPWITWTDPRETARTMIDVVLRGIVRPAT